MIVTSEQVAIHARTRREGRKPAQTFGNGTVTVRMFTIRARKRKPRFEVRYQFNGRKVRKTFSAKSDAEKFAQDQADAIARGQHAEPVLPEMRAVIGAIITRAVTHGAITGDDRSPVIVHDDLCAARERAHRLGITLEKAIDHWQASHAAETLPVPVLVEKFLADVKARAVASKTSLANFIKLRQRLNLFARDFTGPADTVAVPEVRSWLNGRSVSAKTWNHYRAAVLELMAFALAQRAIPRSALDDLRLLKPLRVPPRVPNPYTVAETEKILRHFQTVAPEFVPAIVLVAFCGFRWSEVRGAKGAADWSDIDFERKEIKVWAGHSKVTQDRYAHLPDNAVAWLKLSAKPSGTICPVASTDRFIRRRIAAAGVTIKPNGFRKAFISHRAAVVGNLAQVADEAGNSVAKIKTDYLRRPPKHVGEAYFQILPSIE